MKLASLLVVPLFLLASPDVAAQDAMARKPSDIGLSMEFPGNRLIRKEVAGYPQFYACWRGASNQFVVPPSSTECPAQTNEINVAIVPNYLIPQGLPWRAHTIQFVYANPSDARPLKVLIIGENIVQ
ncbi:hypothetical protein [Pseudoxanthomonas mexicana]